MSELVRYDAMCSAIAECHAVDEALQIKDQARALEVYAAQVKNTEAERKALDIRMRAERRVGELLKALERATPQTANPLGINGAVTSNDATRPEQSPYAQALADNQISRQSASRYQQLAEVPRAEFEAALAGESKPSTTRLLAEARDPAPKLDEDALWLWGRARDFERAHLDAREPAALLAGMTDTMRADMRRIAPLMADCYGAIVELTR